MKCNYNECILYTSVYIYILLLVYYYNNNYYLLVLSYAGTYFTMGTLNSRALNVFICAHEEI